MKKKVYILLVFNLLATILTYAQSFKISDKQEEFVADVSKMLASTKNEKLTQLGSDFGTAWNSLNEAQRTKIIAVTQKMNVKKYRVSPHYESLFGALTYAITKENTPADEYSKLLNVIEKSVNQFDGKTLAEVLKNMSVFFENKALYSTHYSSLQVTGGSYTFEFIGEAAPSEVLPPAEEPKEEKKVEEVVVETPKKDDKKTPAKNTVTKNTAKPKKVDDGWGSFDDKPAEDASKKSADDGWGSFDSKDDKKTANKTNDDGWGSFDDKPKTSSKTKNKTSNTNNKSTAQAKQNDGWGDAPVEEKKPQTDDWGTPATDSEQKTDANSGWGDNFQTPESTFLQSTLPQVSGPVLVLTKADFTFISPHDSAALIGTSGSVMLQNGTFVGKGGKFDWSTAGKPEIYVELKDFSFNVKKSQLSADNVTLHYPEKIETPVPGVFQFASKKHSSPATAEYPKFTSLYSNIVIKDIGPNLVYKGGFSLAGRKMSSKSLYGKMCSLSYVKDGQTKFKTRGTQYEFQDSTIVGQQVSVTIPMRRDSIYHPAARMTYKPFSKQLRLNQKNDGFQNTPYINSFHKVDIVMDGLQWNPDSSEINFYTLNARMEVPGILESHDFYDSTRYFDLRGMYSFHPLQILASQAKKAKRTTFTITELATTYKLNPSVVRNAMIRMMQGGFVDYNSDMDEVRMTRKGDHNVLAGNKKRDYDSFVINSYIKDKPNASLDLQTNTLTVRGVEKFPLSEKLEVYVLPRSKEIQLLKDRNFLLEGEVQAGNFRFKGSGFSFLYDEFTVEMNQIDTILFTPKEAKGKSDSVQLGSEIRYSAGTLYINKPDNKAGLRDYPEYPRLNVQSGAAIYFDQKDRINGSYNRNVRFEVPSITLDSLNSKNPEYKGTFYSDGIFPEFEEDLIAMSDNSLGFKHKVPSGTYQLFGSEDSRMIFAGDLIMDRKGLRASGRIDHLNTTLTAKDIVFTPDSVFARGPQADIKAATLGAVAVPKATVKDFKLTWKAKVDSMMISSTKTPFEIYKETGASFSGTMVVRRNGLFADGQFDRPDSDINSPSFAFEKNKFSAGDAEFRIKSKTLTKPSLLANFVNVNFDMGKGMVEIKTSTNPDLIGFASLEFPYCEYKTSIQEATWLLDKKLVFMKGDVKTSTFTSNNPQHEGLTFNGSVAGYNIDKMTLSISGIPYIVSADARIYPSKGTVMITENAKMQPLSKAVLTLDTTTSYHKLVDGEIQILSRKKFAGNATYAYTNFEGKTFNVKMRDFETRTEEAKRKKDVPLEYTAATGIVDEGDKFYLTSRMLFKGAITMKSPRKYLDLDGFVKLDLKSTSSLADWISYKSKPEDEGVTITVDENLKSGETQMTVGVHVDKETSSVYTTFISAKSHADDKDILMATGQLTNNDEGNEFKVVDPERAKNNKYAGNQFILDDNTGKIRLEGNLRLFEDPGNYLPVSSGSGEIDLKTNKYTFNTLMGWNFPTSTQIYDEMAAGILEAKENEGVGQEAAEDNKERFLMKIAQIIGEKETQYWKDKLTIEYIPMPQISKRFALPLVLSNVDLLWNDESKSFGSVGKIGVSNIGNNDINSAFDGMVEIRKTAEGDQATIYLEVSSDKWYYMNYQQGQYSLLSSDENFNAVVSSKGKGGKSFTVALATENDVNGFKDHFNDTHNKGKEIPKKEKSVVKKEEPKKEEPKKEDSKIKEKPKADDKLVEGEADENAQPEGEENTPPKESKKEKEKKKKSDKKADSKADAKEKKKKEEKPKTIDEEEEDGF
ncbi:hypothetical protein [Xanthocytophaga flava]|uniref:hypothetical protein n=1 Tax=Xanthocytophaga flava TaxID=3048013 RepID=UPI0028D5D0C0|nr:hypothetical protein [Xanthocytophaga flavus]MDJ1468032.1 hypothetical protein [Xanthocytophaga flavus]